MRSIRTDLALEAKEMYEEQTKEFQIPGVKVDNQEANGMKVSRVEIVSPLGERNLGKPMGNYITIEADAVKNRDYDYNMLVSQQISNELLRLVDLNENSTILVVGLGNWNISADALGPKVIGKTFVSRHIKQLLPNQIDERIRPVSAVAPGVLGITGIETGEIIKGIVDKLKPDVVIAIDALAARKSNRIGTSIQICDTGIDPGSGIGNQRMPLNTRSLGAKTIAMGVPMVVYARTIGFDALNMMIQSFSSQAKPGSQFFNMLQQMDEAQLEQMVGEVTANGMGDLVVTPKEVDMLIDDVSKIVADSLNLALHNSMTLEEVNKYMN